MSEASVAEIVRPPRDLSQILEDFFTPETGSKVRNLGAVDEFAQAIAGWVAVAATFLLILAPLTGITAPLAPGGAYVVARPGERHEKRAVARSLMGVLAPAREKT